MESIFDHNPTAKEIDSCFFASFIQAKAKASTSDLKEVYLSERTEDELIFDLAMLSELRGQNADSYWKRIPKLHNEYLLGFDVEETPSN